MKIFLFFMQDFAISVFYNKMKKTVFRKLLFAVVMGMVVPAMYSCSVDESSDNVDIARKMSMVSASFKGKWMLDGQNMGYGKVSIDSMLTLSNLPLTEMLPAMLVNYANNVPGVSTIHATTTQQKIKAEYVGISQTSRYYNLPATQMTFNVTVDGLAYDLKLYTAEKGSVALLQESKNNMSVVVIISRAMLEQHVNGQIVADSRNAHTLIFESDINN